MSGNREMTVCHRVLSRFAKGTEKCMYVIINSAMRVAIRWTAASSRRALGIVVEQLGIALGIFVQRGH